MPLISEQDQDVLRNEFADKVVNPVKMLMFTQETECQFCAETRQIVQEVAALSEHITAEVYDFVADEEMVDLYGIDKIPAIVILGLDDTDYGVRFYGIPSGYEFTSLIEDIIDVSKGESGLSAKTKEKVAAIDQPVHIQVFVTPTCPYCTQAVRLAHKLAIESSHIRGDMVEAIEFPHLANKYHIRGVPTVVINDTISFVGNRPESYFVEQILKATE